jgi:hypothetical protein
MSRKPQGELFKLGKRAGKLAEKQRQAAAARQFQRTYARLLPKQPAKPPERDT